MKNLVKFQTYRAALNFCIVTPAAPDSFLEIVTLHDGFGVLGSTTTVGFTSRGHYHSVRKQGSRAPVA